MRDLTRRPAEPPPGLSAERSAEWLRCRDDAASFIGAHARIYDNATAGWIPFLPWPSQAELVRRLPEHNQLVILKARRQGFTLTLLAAALHASIFRPIQQAYLFSIGDREAMELTNVHLRGMCQRLPDWITGGRVECTAHAVHFANGSRITSLPSGAGRSYTATLVIVDEADFTPDLAALLAAVEPTIEGGGRIVLVSTADKSQPMSPFKQVFRAAQRGEGGYTPLFFGWRARPGRDQAWYAEQRRTILQRTGSLDMLHQEYPDTPDEALAPLELSARIPPAWVQQCFEPLEPLRFDSASMALHGLESEAPYLPGILIWRLPQPGRHYVLGVDPSEGQPGSHESPIHVLDADSAEEMALFPGPAPMHILGDAIVKLAAWYNGAGVLIERNNHGHAVLLWLADHGEGTYVMNGPDGRPGWSQGQREKMLLYDRAAARLRERQTIIHDPQTQAQLCSIEANTLKAPEGMPDDRAMSFVITLTAADCCPRGVLDLHV